MLNDSVVVRIRSETLDFRVKVDSSTAALRDFLPRETDRIRTLQVASSSNSDALRRPGVCW